MYRGLIWFTLAIKTLFVTILVGRIVKAYDQYHERKLAGETAETNAASKDHVAKG